MSGCPLCRYSLYLYRQKDVTSAYFTSNGYGIITDMEPKLPSPNFGHEHMPIGPSQNAERIISEPQIFERPSESVAERIEQRAETPVVPVLPTPVIPPVDPMSSTQVAQSTTIATPVASGAPLAANDDDLIEKEWVDKAKKIIIETKDDPYRREQEVGQLQVDYLRKRYGRELGAPQ